MDKSDMKIAVLMSTYNGEKFINKQLESIFLQNCKADIDIWVRDDGSTDNTTEILEHYQRIGKLKWYKGDNVKPAKSFMELLINCGEYDYYAFADQDDVWYPSKLQRGIDKLKNINKEAMYFSNANLVDENGDGLGRAVYRKRINYDFYSLVTSSAVLGCTIIFNQKLAEKVIEAGMPNRLIMHDCYISIVCSALYGNIIYDETPTMDYRQHNNNVIGSKIKKVDALKDRFKRIFKPASVSIAEQAETVLDLYKDELSTERKQWLERISSYKDSFGKALTLAFSRKPKYNSRNMEITMRLSILTRKH